LLSSLPLNNGNILISFASIYFKSNWIYNNS
jgi:hypothetical protein